VDSLDDAGKAELYRKLRWFARGLAMRNPLVAAKPIVFMERRRFACQMLHEYLAYFHEGMEGGGVFLLKEPGKSMEVKDLVGGRLPPGSYTTLAMSYDAKTMWFAFAEKDKPKTDFYAPKPGCSYFHIYAMEVDGGNLRQVTDGPADDFDPCELPDGGMAFMSWRRGAGFIRCSNPWEPIPAYTLHRMDRDGKNVRTLSFHETNEWHPTVLNDGRIAYIRWDYVDRSAANFHGIWTCNPDGSNPASLFGNYTAKINACYQPRAIPGSEKILFVAGAHHADVGGCLVMLDPKRVKLDAAGGEDRLDAVEVITPEVRFPETSKDWGKSYFHGAWPLSEDYYLVGFSFDGLPGGPGGKKDETGIYYLDRWGNMELLYRKPGIASMYPIPVEGRARPGVIASMLDRNLGEEGEFMVADVRRSFLGLPTDRRVKELRVWQVLPKTTHIANDPKIGHANAESARMLLGTVPVEVDGSAYFRAPARKPVYFQAVDELGMAVQTMRSITYLQPGERRGCVGCHEPGNSVVESRGTLAMKRGVSRIEVGPDGTRPFSYVRLVQPILDQQCVRCHEAQKSGVVLTGGEVEKNGFTKSYNAMRKYVRWYEWGGESIDQAVTRPGHGGASDSRLLSVLGDGNHQEVKLSDEERRRLYIWLDGNVPFYGTYGKEEQEAQRRGVAVAEPRVQ
ncbi:MAG: hypothetical protein NTU53_00945, partial [Planctomycetota bacterium]|nr:hypothetical protein [Planctomycetota bacterium]